MDPATATVIAGALTATVAAGAAATSAGVSQQESGFIAGATIVNKSSLDFEVSFFNEIRGSWGKAPSRDLLGAQTVLTRILNAHPIDPTQAESSIERYVKEKIISDSFAETSFYYSGLNHGLGFQGCLRLRNDEKNITIILYIGRPRNLTFRAAAWIGNSSSSQVSRHRTNANSWENWMNDVRNSNETTGNPTFSLGSTRITKSNDFEIKYTSAERVMFEIKDGWDTDFIAPFNWADITYGSKVSFRSAHNQYLVANNNGQLFANSNSLGNEEQFTILNAENLNSRGGQIKYGDKVALQSTFNRYMVANLNGTADINHAQLNPSASWTILNPADTNDRSELGAGKKVTFKSTHERYLVAERNGVANANRTQIGSWEKWDIMPA
ncbi:MAG: hypothetical protein AB8G22_27175 [Saprospiraceae bacterium]